jgi:hypothetical protein
MILDMREVKSPSCDLRRCTVSRRLKVLVVALILAFPIALAVHWQRTDTVTFRVVDAASGRPLVNAAAFVMRRATPFPIEKVFHNFMPWTTQIICSEDGSLVIAGVPRTHSESFVRIMFAAPGYNSAFVRVGEDGNYWLQLSEGQAIPVPRTNFISLRLERKEGK